MPIKKISRYVICVMMSLAFVLLAAKSSYSAEHAPIIYAFYCPSEEIPFIGELMPPVLSIMEDDKVKAELDLSNTQIEKLRETDKAFFAGVKDVLTLNENKGRDLMWSGGRLEDHVMAIEKLSEDARKRTSEILKPHQLSRLKELLLRLYGVLFIPKKDLRQLMEVDKEQARAIDEIRSDIFKRIDETASPNSVIASASHCKFATSKKRDIAVLLEESERSVNRLLSPEQKKNVERLKGKSFSF